VNRPPWHSAANRSPVAAPLPAPVSLPYYGGRDEASYECRGFPGGDYGAWTWEDARLWLAIDPPADPSAACIVEIGASGDRVVWPESRFGEPDPLSV